MAEVVTIICKTPNGIIMELLDAKGNRVPDSPRVLARGANSARVIGGYGVSDNVDKAFAEAWFKRNAKLAVVQNELILIQPKAADAEAAAAERKDEKSGLEPIDTANLDKDKRLGISDPKLIEADDKK